MDKLTVNNKKNIQFFKINIDKLSLKTNFLNLFFKNLGDGGHVAAELH